MSSAELQLLNLHLNFGLMKSLNYIAFNFTQVCVFLSSLVQFTGMLQILILMASETEARYTSVERIQSYMKVRLLNNFVKSFATLPPPLSCLPIF